MKIDNTSIIHKSAVIGDNVEIGPYCIIDENVVIGSGTKIFSYVHILPNTKIGKNNVFHQGSIVGGIPQDLKYNNEYSELIIGNNNTIREYCTLNKGTEASGKTVIGSDCLLMAYVHVAHDCVIGDHSILANAVQLGGHVEIGNHVTIGGMTPVHQFCKIGDYAFIGGGYRIVQDIPPYILAMGEPLKYSGLNVVGLRRKKFSSKLRKQLKQIYQIIYQSKLNRTQAIAQIKASFKATPEVKHILEFIENSDRGLI